MLTRNRSNADNRAEDDDEDVDAGRRVRPRNSIVNMTERGNGVDATLFVTPSTLSPLPNQETPRADVNTKGPYWDIARLMNYSIAQFDVVYPKPRRFDIFNIKSIDSIEVRVYLEVKGGVGNFSAYLRIKSVHLPIPNLIRRLKQTSFLLSADCEPVVNDIFRFLVEVRYDKVLNEFVKYPRYFESIMESTDLMEAIDKFSHDLKSQGRGHIETHPKCVVCEDLTSTKFSDRVAVPVNCSHSMCYICISKNQIQCCPICLVRVPWLHRQSNFSHPDIEFMD